MRIHHALLGMMLAVLSGGARAVAADVTGAWLLHAEWGPTFKYDLICGLTQTGQAVSGTCMGVVPPERASGSLDGDKLELEYVTLYQGYDVDTRYHGVIDSNGGVSGTVEAGPSQGWFDGVQVGDKGPVMNWKLHVRIATFDVQMLCAMKVKGRMLSGPCAAGDGVILDASGSVDEKGLSLAYDDSRLSGAPLHVVYSGTFQPGGSLMGTATDGAHAGTFAARRW
jgi:hypothetical protein